VNSIRIKICGITSVEDAQLAINAGADALGLVFYEPSPRSVTIEQAAIIAGSVGPFVTVVGLFVDADEVFIKDVLAQVPLHVLQFHGNEPPEFCRTFQRPYMKAIRMQPELNLEDVIDTYPDASAILLDAYRPGIPGGTGETFDWLRIPKNTLRPLVLAGGLTPENVALAISSASVYGVDVSGGVESTPGKKAANKITAFIRNAKNA
jgi:phosphoribosylanthranilate isomerase